MRIDSTELASYENSLWRVWHATECRSITNCVWADDVTNQWCEECRGVMTFVHSVDRIIIDMNARMVVINPIDDADQDVSFADDRRVLVHR